MVATRIWIIDGHNMIFAIHGLERLQVSGHREEARFGLVDRLRRFAQTRGEQVLVVFDGIDLLSNPDAIREPFLEVVYARRREGAADDRIIHEARSRTEQGRSVTVVTDDVNTLAGELPKGVRHLKVQAFWLKYIEVAAEQTCKRVEGDFSDVERAMIAWAAVAERAETESSRREREGTEPAGASGPRTTRGNAGAEGPGERLRRKREKGRLRQERRLKRRVRR